MEINKIYNEDCLSWMQRVPNESIDCIICDLPYGTTELEWDKPIPFVPLWAQYERVIKQNGAIILFSTQPFTTDLINSNRKLFRYEIIYKKTQATGFFNAKKCPLRIHENILVFYKHLPTYNPIKSIKEGADIGRTRKNVSDKITGAFMGRVGKNKTESWVYKDDGTRYPTDVIEFSNWNGSLFGKKYNAVKHPTQKPVQLIEYLIKTYSNEGDLIMDNCIGSGTTAIACIRTNRKFLGCEINKDYYQLALSRIEEEKRQPRLFY